MLTSLIAGLIALSPPATPERIRIELDVLIGAGIMSISLARRTAAAPSPG